MQFDPDSSDNWAFRTDAALAWLRRSITATGGQGSAHSYSPVWGWARAYPETTGYLLPTLLRYAELKQDDTLRQLACTNADWLSRIQLPSGAFPGGTAGQVNPSLFNTSQILFGLSKLDAEILAEENLNARIWRSSLEQAARWMLDILEPDATWRQAAYVPGHLPAYYSRAVWGLLRANSRLQWPEMEAKMRAALRFYARFFRPDGTVDAWGLRPGAWGFTHTIAYTLEGFLESALILNEPEILEQAIHAARALLEVRNTAGRSAGRYAAGWRGDYSFLCLAGNLQLSILCHRIWSLTGIALFRESSQSFLYEILDFQNLGANPNTFGALAGSAPVWGPYLRFRYPNWGVKFFLDAMENWRNNVNFD